MGSTCSDRYDRSIRLFTTDGQLQIQETSVMVVGCGGLGSVLVEELARLGVEQLVLVDPDVVEESNLSRLVGSMPEHIGEPKVQVLGQHIWHTCPDVDVDTYPERVQDLPMSVFGDVDVIAAGVDTVTARSYTNEMAVRYEVPYIDAGVRIDTDNEEVGAVEGVAQTIQPGQSACFDCLDRGDPQQMRIEGLSDGELWDEVDRGYLPADVLEPEPAVVHLNGVVASHAVDQFTRLVTGILEPVDLLRIDLLGYELVPMHSDRKDHCVTCGEDGVLGRGKPAPVDDGSERSDPGVDIPEVNQG